MESYLEELHGLLVGKFGVREYHLILRNCSGKYYFSRSFPEAPPLARTWDLSSAKDWFQEGKTSWLYFPDVFREAVPKLEVNLEGWIRKEGIQYCFRIVSKGLQVGLLFLKAQRVPYETDEFEVLEFLARGLGEICYQSILAEEMDYVGWISEGLAHDFQSLLTPISTYLQLRAGGGEESARADEILPEALRGLEMIRSCIKEGLLFSKNQKPLIRSVRFEELIRTVLELAAVQFKRKAISVRVDAEAGLQLELDEIFAVRLFLNLLLNGIMAAPAGSAIEIRAFQVTEEGRAWTRVELCDQGPGISEEKIMEATLPDGKSGLGLSICNRIAQLHGARINFSKPGEVGTLVRVDFPM